MRKYDCVDCKRPVEILVPEENICTDCYIARLKLRILRLSCNSSAMQALLERVLVDINEFNVTELDDVAEQIVTLLKEAEVNNGKH